jgi:mRNA interferase MazF
MEKDFDKWNQEKKVVDRKNVNRNLFFYPREIWWCSAGLNIGVEADGKNENFERPMLIIKKFNTDMIWGLPLTTKEKQNKYHFKLEHQEIKSWVILSQIKTISTKRLLRKVGSISDSDFREVVSRVQILLKIEKPRKGAFSEAEATNANIVDEHKT